MVSFGFAKAPGAFALPKFTILGHCGIQAPGQNRTDTSSLEGYSSTIELQARKMIYHYVDHPFFLQSRNYTTRGNLLFWAARGIMKKY